MPSAFVAMMVQYTDKKHLVKKVIAIQKAVHYEIGQDPITFYAVDDEVNLMPAFDAIAYDGNEPPGYLPHDEPSGMWAKGGLISPQTVREMKHFVCTCTPDSCSGEEDDGCEVCRSLDGEMPCPAEPEFEQSLLVPIEMYKYCGKLIEGTVGLLCTLPEQHSGECKLAMPWEELS